MSPAPAPLPPRGHLAHAAYGWPALQGDLDCLVHDMDWPAPQGHLANPGAPCALFKLGDHGRALYEIHPPGESYTLFAWLDREDVRP